VVGRVLPLFLLAALLATSVVSGIAAPAGAQQELIDSDPQVAQALKDLQAAQSAAHDAANRIVANRQQQTVLQGRIAANSDQIAQLTQQTADLTVELNRVLDVVRARSLALYVGRGSYDGLSDILGGRGQTRLLRALYRQRLTEAAAHTDQAMMRHLNATKAALSDTKAEAEREQTTLENQQASLRTLDTQLAQQQDQMNQSVATANVLLERARAVGAFRAQRSPIMGPSLLSVDQMVGWYSSRGYRPNLPTGVTVAQLAALFVQEGRDENVRGDVAFAQSIIETGGFASAPDNNYSGIGWCDSCSSGVRFPTPQDGIRAQVQLLRNYADSTSRAANLSHPPSPYLYDPNPSVAAREFDTFFAKGWAPTWSDMGHGNWATDPGYSSKVLNIYQSMTTFAQAR